MSVRVSAGEVFSLGNLKTQLQLNYVIVIGRESEGVDCCGGGDGDGHVWLSASRVSRISMPG